MRLRGKEVNVKSTEIGGSRRWAAHLYASIYRWACERLYLELAWLYDGVSRLVSLGHWGRWQAWVWREVRGHDVLEMGFGTGKLLMQGRQRGMEMVGLDRSPAMLEVARQRAMKMHTPLRALQGDGCALPFGESVFDTVMATFPAGYIFDPTTLAEMHRVLRAGGRLVLLGLWVELHLGWVGRLLPVFYGRPGQASLDAMVQRVAAAGFRAHWVEQRDGYFTVGVLVADRE